MNELDTRTAYRLQAIKAATKSKSMSAIELADAIHICHQSTLAYVRELHGDGRIHIAGWRDTSPGKRAALYRWGHGDDAPKPAPKTRAELQRAYKERLRKDGHGYDRLLATDRARYSARKAASTKNTWLGALQ